MSMDRPKRVSRKVSGSWCCCLYPTAQMLKAKARKREVLLRKQHCTNSDKSGMELKNLRRTQHQSENRKKGTTLSKGAQNPWADTSRAYKDVEQYHHKNTEKSFLLPLSSHNISGLRGSLGVSALRFWPINYPLMGFYKHNANISWT